MELKCKELESKLELEQTTRSRLEVQIARLKETVDKLQSELVTSRTKEQAAQDTIRKLQRSLRYAFEIFLKIQVLPDQSVFVHLLHGSFSIPI